jgi:poly(3-hydroxybutyrate) depolymerase
MFRVAPPLELKKLEAIFRHKVFKMLLSQGKITQEMVAMLSTWRHSGFNVFLRQAQDGVCGKRISPKDDTAMENIARYMPLNLKDRKVTTPVSMLIMNGTNDPWMPYKRGYLIGSKVELISSPETALFWARAAGCKEEPLATLLPDVRPDDDTRVARMDYPDCREGIEVVLYSVENGGHTWPNGDQYMPEKIIGKVTRDIDANQILMKFFKKKRK